TVTTVSMTALLPGGEGRPFGVAEFIGETTAAKVGRCGVGPLLRVVESQDSAHVTVKHGIGGMVRHCSPLGLVAPPCGGAGGFSRSKAPYTRLACPRRWPRDPEGRRSVRRSSTKTPVG